MVEVTVLDIIARLQGDQRGTAMTEFVITLPVFLIIFLGINGLSRLQDAATRAHPEANRAMWEQAHEVANSQPNSTWGTPDALGKYAGGRVDHDTLGYDEVKFRRLYDHGTLGEAMTGSQFSETRDWEFVLEIPAGEDNCAGCARDWAAGDLPITPGFADYALMDRGLFRPRLPSVDPEFRAMRGTFPTNPPKSRLAYGAGTRYGLVYGEASREVTWRRFSTTFKPLYQATAPSRTLETDAEAFQTVATPRVELERWEWADLPGFEDDHEFSLLFGLGAHDHILRRH